MLYIYLPVLYYYGNLYVTKGAYAGGRGFLLSQRSFLLLMQPDHALGHKKAALDITEALHIKNEHVYTQ